MSTKFCPACSTNVSTKLWTAHTTGRKHKQRVAELKAQAAKSSSKFAAKNNGIIASGDKRPLQVSSDDVDSSAKRSKLENCEQGLIATTKHISASSASNEFAFIPAGFFDNPEQNDKTEATIEKQKLLDAEYQKFMNEISAVEQEVAAEDDVDVKAFTHERQLESIDETMGYWKSLNALEKRKEAIAEVHKNQEMDETKDDEKEEESDDEEFEIDFEGDNWRSRKIF
uniref:U1-type domain-containing protein n=1 Tax=Panagrolaimus sp. ES5 TaxID=591445 RepID=A0AC34GXB7_9BILA